MGGWGLDGRAAEQVRGEGERGERQAAVEAVVMMEVSRPICLDEDFSSTRISCEAQMRYTSLGRLLA